MVVYVVHLRSPRADLAHYREWRYWKNTIYGVPKTEWHADHLCHYWQEQYEAMRRVVAEIEKETLPTLVLGDWNVPDSGPRYRQITRSLDDAHREAGTGYGYTFPGDLKHWAALNEPWMRIDYVLCSRGDWEVLECSVQQEAADSQHRAVKARVRLR